MTFIVLAFKCLDESQRCEYFLYQLLYQTKWNQCSEECWQKSVVEKMAEIFILAENSFIRRSSVRCEEAVVLEIA